MPKMIKSLPRREPLELRYTDKKDRKMISMRLPETLIAQLKACSVETGYSFTEIAQYALDQFCQVQEKTGK